jgi:pyruvate/2-oxoglutarate dehydrogenase complex dihydrolipoamide dehydrogenase (E3) component
LSVHRADFAHNDRAVATGKPKGFLKLMVVKSRPVGVTIVGDGAGELIGLWSLAMQARLKLSAISATILPYPTLSEASKRAAGAYFSPKLFESAMVKRVVGLVQRFVP